MHADFLCHLISTQARERDLRSPLKFISDYQKGKARYLFSSSWLRRTNAEPMKSDVVKSRSYTCTEDREHM